MADVRSQIRTSSTTSRQISSRCSRSSRRAAPLQKQGLPGCGVLVFLLLTCSVGQNVCRFNRGAPVIFKRVFSPPTQRPAEASEGLPAALSP